jgi:hypothetical protein
MSGLSIAIRASGLRREREHQGISRRALAVMAWDSYSYGQGQSTGGRNPAGLFPVGLSKNRTILDHDQLLSAGHPDHGPESVEKRVAKPACLTIQRALVLLQSRM